ncbi:MAG: hypothetical protein HKN17_10250 [Rhodothermales bacterium]|nr:hypothetical protein [Rhodothermales bacterium]
MSTLHTVLVIAFIGVTALLLGVTLVHRMRIQRVRMSWCPGQAGSLPIWPVVFIGVVAVFLVYAGNTFPVISFGVFSGYLLGGILWFCAVLLSSTVVVTEYGVIPEVGRTGEAVGWGQIRDYFEVSAGKQVHFVFIYSDFLGEKNRMEITVPAARERRFRSILREKLDTRLESTATRTASRQTAGH